jgi:hypothetical protein
MQRAHVEEADSELVGIIRGMAAARIDAEVQQEGCVALLNLSCKNDANQVKIAALGGIEGVVAAMNVHFDNAGVQHRGCMALVNLAGKDANQVKIAALGGIEAVVTAMNAHRGSDNVQHYGCCALNNITWRFCRWFFFCTHAFKPDIHSFIHSCVFCLPRFWNRCVNCSKLRRRASPSPSLSASSITTKRKSRTCALFIFLHL